MGSSQIAPGEGYIGYRGFFFSPKGLSNIEREYTGYWRSLHLWGDLKDISGHGLVVDLAVVN